MTDYKVEVQAKLTFSSSTCFWPWRFITVINDNNDNPKTLVQKTLNWGRNSNLGIWVCNNGKQHVIRDVIVIWMYFGRVENPDNTRIRHSGL